MANVKSHYKLLKSLNSRGSAFLQALVAVIVCGIIMYSLSPWIIEFKKQSMKNSNLISSRLAVHSLLDYTLVGIKQKWCFSSAWTPEPCGQGVLQSINHPRSIDRLLLTEESLDYLKLLGVSNWSSAKITKIEHELAVSSITTNNPVYKIFQNLDSKVNKLKISISVDNNAALPQYGDEVYLRVEVSLLDRSGETINIGSSKLRAVSYVGVYPREVGSFALILANNLYLDRSSAYTPQKGDAYIKKFSSRTSDLVNSGLIFNSPVFVNSDIYLTSSNEKSAYTPVTFKEKVYLGAGVLKRDGVGFVPNTAGGTDSQYWTDILQFGGFKGGVEVDGKKDLGLEYLSGERSAASSSDADLLKKCIANTAANSLLTSTDNSRILGELLSTSSNLYRYRLQLTEYNKFNAQTGNLPEVTSQKTGSSGLGLYDSKYTNSSNGAVLKYNLKVGNLTISGVVPEGGSSILTTESNLQSRIDLYQSSIQANNKTIASNNSEISQLESTITSQEKNLDSIESAIDAEKRKIPSDYREIQKLENQYDNVKDSIRNNKRKISNLKSDISNLESSNVSLKNNLDDAYDMHKKKATIEISANRIVGKTGETSTYNPSYRELNIKTSTPEWLIDETGKKLDVSIELEAMDVSYELFESKRDPTVLNKNLTKGSIDLSWSWNTLNASRNLKDLKGNNRGDTSSQDLYVNFDEVCKTVDYSSFASVGWESSFAEVSRHSWSFTNTYAERADYVFNIDNASTAGGRVPAFVIKSIVKNCIIEATANFVTGFLTCESLTIRARSTPLTIVGTFIVSNGMTIDDSAYKAGIKWQSIYHPMSTYLLRSAKVLKAVGGGSCDSLTRTPVWHPRPALLDRVNAQQCNAMALRLKADPFRWTSVDPDCGLISASSTATFCKNSLGNYFALEIHRESGI